LLLTSLVPFFLLMTIFIGMGYLFCRILPPYNSEVRQLPAKRGYNVELESMRGLLALGVVVHHALVWYFLMYRHTSYITGPNATFYSQLGTAPVTFFFFITGFLFWSKLISDPKPPVGRFMVARLRRLGPAYLGSAALMFTLVALFTHFKLDGSPVAVARDAVRMILGRPEELNGLATAPWLWAVTWTLQFEFLFYLLVPFLGWFAQSLWKTLLFIAGCNVLYGASLLVAKSSLHVPAFPMLQALVRFLSFTFCVGFVTAHLVKMPAIRGFARSVFAAPLTVAVILLTLCLVPSAHGPLESLALALPFVLIASGCDFWGALRQRALLFLGQISYSVYMVHCLVFGAVLIPLFSVLHTELESTAVYWTVMFLTAPVLIVVATVWNRSFELPFMTKGSSAAGAKPALPELVNMPYAKGL
jgi:peptidoglycan/LPS O-acetylase OafA/YrhL